MAFHYYWKSSEIGSHKHAITVPRAISDKETLLRELATRGRFPDHFGQNWDALLDCLRDFSWFDDLPVAIIHQDVPLARHMARAYLEILLDASQCNAEQQPTISVYFPATTLMSIDTILV